MKSTRKILAVACALSMVAALAAACGGKDAGKPADSNQAKGKDNAKAAESKGPFELSMMITIQQPAPPEGNDMIAAIEKYTNTKLKMQWVPQTAAGERMSVAIASGDMPMVMHLDRSTPVQNAMKNGVFWELSPFIKDYPNLAAINPEVYKNMALDGKLYTIAQERPLTRAAFVYRKDWLDSLGLKEPQTLDELYAAAKAMVEKDPDKNGKADTQAFYDYKPAPNAGGMPVFKWIQQLHGAPNGWAVGADGKLVPEFMTPQYFDAIKFYKKLYDEKLINRDFAVTELPQWYAAFEQGKAGLEPMVTGAAYTAQINTAKNDPKAVIDFIGLMKGPDGKTNSYAGSGFNMTFGIPKSTVKTEAEVRKILEFYNKLGDGPMLDLVSWGIEGKHHAVKDGKAEMIADAQKDYKSLRDPILQIYGVNPETSTKVKPGNVHPLLIKATKVNKEMEPHAVHNATNALFSPTNAQSGKELEIIIQDARTKYIMGAANEEAWKKAQDEWLKRGGQKIIDEFTAEYNKMNKK